MNYYPRKPLIYTAQAIYQVYALAYDRQGVTVNQWNELSELEINAWERVADYLYERIVEATERA